MVRKFSILFLGAISLLIGLVFGAVSASAATAHAATAKPKAAACGKWTPIYYSSKNTFGTMPGTSIRSCVSASATKHSVKVTGRLDVRVAAGYSEKLKLVLSVGCGCSNKAHNIGDWSYYKPTFSSTVKSSSKARVVSYTYASSDITPKGKASASSSISFTISGHGHVRSGGGGSKSPTVTFAG